LNRRLEEGALTLKNQAAGKAMMRTVGW